MDERLILAHELIVVDVERDDEARNLRRDRHRAPVRVGVVGRLDVQRREIKIGRRRAATSAAMTRPTSQSLRFFSAAPLVLRLVSSPSGCASSGASATSPSGAFSSRSRSAYPALRPPASRFPTGDPCCDPLDSHLAAWREPVPGGACAGRPFRCNVTELDRYGYTRFRASQRCIVRQGQCRAAKNAGTRFRPSRRACFLSAATPKRRCSSSRSAPAPPRKRSTGILAARRRCFPKSCAGAPRS